MSRNPASENDGFTNYNYNYNYNYVLNTQNSSLQQQPRFNVPQKPFPASLQERVNTPAPMFSFAMPSQAAIAQPTGPWFMNETQALPRPSFNSPSSMEHAVNVDSYGFLPQSPFHRMSLFADPRHLLPNPRTDLPQSGNGLEQETFSQTEYTTSSITSAQPFQQPFHRSARPPPASDAYQDWVVQGTRTEWDDSKYMHAQGTFYPTEYTTSPVGDASWRGTIAHPSNRQREESQRLSQPILFNHTPGNPHLQLPLPPCPVSVYVPLPMPENRWGSPHQVQSASNSSSVNIQMRQDPTGHHRLGQTLNEGTQESASHYSSNLHQGELERHKSRCHRLPATGWQTSSEHEVAERNQFHAGHPSESRHEEYKPLHYPAQRDSATRRRQYDIGGPSLDMQSQIRHLEPASATLPSYDMGPFPSSFSSTMELFSESPSSSQLIAFQFEEDFRTNKSAKKVTLLKHVVPQVLFANPLTVENPPQYDDSDSEGEEEEEEESDPEDGEDSDPDGAERRS